MQARIRAWFINTNTSIYDAIGKNNDHIELVDNAEQADVIIYENHSPQVIRKSIEFKKWPEKCVSVNAEDDPTYFLPGCYASNSKGILSYGRGQTIPYMRMDREGPNKFIKPFNHFNCRYLYAFRGGSTSWLRKKLFKSIPSKNDVFVTESNHYVHWSIEDSYKDTKAFLQKEYADLLEQSLFFLCPRGAGSGTIRLFEVMKAGRVPVIISDSWIPVEGFNWSEFSLRIREKDLSKIDEIIRSNKINAERLGAKAQQIYRDHFAPGPDLLLLANALRAIQNHRNESKERLIRSLFPLVESAVLLQQKGYNSLKFIILRLFALTGRKFPYSLNRPIENQLQHKD